MSSDLGPDLPILGALTRRIPYGTSLLVEFEPRSIWNEASLTIAAHALKNGVPTEYHTFQRVPGEIRNSLTNLGLNVKELQENGVFTVIDSYTIQTRLGNPEISDASASNSLKLADWSIDDSKHMKAGIPESEKRQLHVDDNISILLDYNEEKEFIDYYRTRLIPFARAHEMIALHAIVTDIASDSFYKKLESLCDGIVEFKSEEREERIGQQVRMSAFRGRTFDSRWRRLQLLETGEVTVVD